MGRLIVCDLDGVVYRGDEPIAGAGAALSRLSVENQVLFCTNNAWKTPAEVSEKILRVTGFEVGPENVVTSAMAAATLIERGPVLPVGGNGIRLAISERGFDLTEDALSAETVVAGLDLALSYDTLARATVAIRGGADFIATNLDATYPVAAGLYPGAGALIAALEVASGVRAVPAGKPHQPMRRMIREIAGDRSVIVVGDRDDTDLAMAYAEGWDSVLVLTGVTEDPTGSGAGMVLATLAELPDRL